MDQPAIIDLLCRCLAPPSGGDFVSRLAGLTSQEWDHVLGQAQRHGLVPLLEHRLRSRCPDLDIPPDAAQKLKKAVHVCVGRNLWIFNGLSKILPALNSAGIPVIALKGAHLASQIYRSNELRQMRDVDIMIPVTHLVQAVSVFEALGYASADDVQIEEVQARSQHLPLFTRKGEVPVEIHWAIERPTSPFSLDLEGLWQRSRPVTVAGASTRVLSPEDLLLHLCLHAGYHHRFVVSLQVFADIAEILRHHGDRFDWTVVEARAGVWGAARLVHACLHLAKVLVKAEVPDDWLRRCEPSDFDPAIIGAVREQLQLFSKDGPRVPLLSRRHARLWGVDWPYFRPSFWFGRFFRPQRSPATKKSMASDSSRSFFYYPERAGDFMRKIGGAGRHILYSRKERKEKAERERLLGTYFTRQ